MTKSNNRAFVDAQNLYLSTKNAEDPWKIDMRRFRVYLKEKYNVDEAYCFFGAYEDRYSKMYQSFEEYGYILVFREHGAAFKGKKKGNVDVDIVFEVMRELLEKEAFEKVVLVSGDGDYKRMVSYLIEIGRFEKILLPNKATASSLYKGLSSKYYDYLDSPAMRVKFGL